jgi:hypothetical protein
VATAEHVHHEVDVDAHHLRQTAATRGVLVDDLGDAHGGGAEREELGTAAMKDVRSAAPKVGSE